MAEETKQPTSVKSEPVLSDTKLATKPIAAPAAPAVTIPTGPGVAATISGAINKLSKQSTDKTLSLNKAISYLSAALVQLEKHEGVETKS